MKMLDSGPSDVGFQSNSPSVTESLGEQIGKLLQRGDVLRLTGNLGAGKTCLARGIARGWGAVETASSPTFALIHEYHRLDGSRLYHMDGYRLADVDDALSTGLEDLLDAGEIVVIEWPERISEMLPTDSLLIKLTAIGESSRRLTISAGGPQSQRLVIALSEENS